MLFYFDKNKFYKRHSQNQDFTRQLLEYGSDGRWVPIQMQSQLQNLDLMNELQFKKWVLLKKQDNGWVQVGPFSSEEVFLKLKNGELSPSSYIWKKGFKKWVKMVETTEFSGLFVDKNFDTSYELLESVVEAPIYGKSRSEESLENEHLLKKVSYMLKDLDFAQASVSLEAKSARSLHRKATFVFRNQAYSSKKRSSWVLIGFFLIIGLIAIVIYLNFA